MTEHEWLTSNDPQAMLRLAERTSNEGMIIAIPRQALFRVSDRKLRLWCDALRQMKFYDLPRGSYRRNWNQGEPDPDEQSGEVERLVRLWAAVGVGNCEPSQSTKANLLRDIFGNPWKPVIIQPHWLTPTVKALAQAAYEERQNPACYHCRGAGRVAPAQTEGIAITVQSTPCQTCHGTGRIETGHLDPDRLLILADALEEAGCDNEEMLRHLRGICRRCRGKRVINRRVSDPYDGVGRATVQLSCPDCVCSTCDGNGFYFDDSGGNIGCRKHCSTCDSSGHLPTPCHIRGCWVLDLLLGKS